MPDEAIVLKAIASLKTELTELVKSEIATLSAEISHLKDGHSEALLRQEQRNSDFAQRERLESVAEHVHTNANKLMSFEGRITRLEGVSDKLDAQIEAVDLVATNRHISLWQSGVGYVISAMLTAGGLMGGFALSHLVH